MKKAIDLPQYADVQPFAQPPGVVDVQLDKTTNLLATPSCPETYTMAFIAGTEPNQTCDQRGGIKAVFSRIFGLGTDKALPPPAAPAAASPPPRTQAIVAASTPAKPADAAAQDAKKKKGFFGKLAGIFKNDKPSSSPANAPGDSAHPSH